MRCNGIPQGGFYHCGSKYEGLLLSLLQGACCHHHSDKRSYGFPLSLLEILITCRMKSGSFEFPSMKMTCHLKGGKC